MKRANAAMVLITYTPGPAVHTKAYEPWLRSQDNPTFNRIAGVAEYSNWKIRSPKAFPCSHFDFLYLRRPRDLERVWFSAELDRFRARWVEKWGYGSAGPSVVSAYATLFVRSGAPLRTRRRFLELQLDPPESSRGERWEAVEALRKHWAIGRAPHGQKWRIPISQFNPLGWGSIALTFHSDLPDAGVAAECIAAPFLSDNEEKTHG